jgi:anti-sigma-K factor RskA
MPPQPQLLIAGYILGDLDPEEAAELEQLLSHNSAMTAEAEQMQKALELAYGVSEVRPPDHLRSMILNAAQPQSADRPAITPEVNRNLITRNWWNRSIAAAAAMVILALGINNYRLWQALQANRTPQPLEPVTYSLQSTGANAATAAVQVNPNTLEAELTVQNLPSLPPGKTYALWTILKKNAPFTADAKGAVLTEAFNVDAQGTVSRRIAVPDIYRAQEWIARVAVTVEDANAPQKHQGKPILVTQ